jgi:hypothetical protein
LVAAKFGGIEHASSKPAAKVNSLLSCDQVKTTAQKDIGQWSTIVEFRDGCEHILRVLQIIAENYECAGKTVECGQIHQSQREILVCCVHQQKLLK